MTTLFISDLHLTPERPRMLTLFVEFLQQEARECEALYILGDLFEVWLGDDAMALELEPVLEALHSLTASGVPVWVMVGNRDFLLGAGFEARSGCRLLADPAIIDLYGTPTLLLHGDTLCTDDHEYQVFRAQVRDPQWQAGFLARSVAERIAFGKQAREESRARTREKPEEIMDINPQAVIAALQRHHVSRLIHGHTHRPAIHRIDLPDTTATRIVLGDWYDQASVLRVDAGSIALTGNPRTRWY